MYNLVQETAKILKIAHSPVVLTGAGVSKESGVPTFRDALEGLWEQYDPQELATPEAYQRNPKLVWDWYEFRRKQVARVKPNAGHLALVDIEKHCGTLPIITQNVDHLHEQAGSSDVIHLHGNIQNHKCFYNCEGNPTPIDISTLDYDENDGPPTCPYCHRKSVRVDVVWFGEMLPEAMIRRAYTLSGAADVMIVIGTSGLVTPAANLPRVAKKAGAIVIEVNPDHTPISSIADIRLAGASGEMLPQLVAALSP